MSKNISDDVNPHRYLQLNEFESNNVETMNDETDIYNLDSIEKNEPQIVSSNLHNFNIRFFYRPILCVHCMDYIWGSGYIGHGCKRCGQCVHFKCLIFVVNTSSCLENENVLDVITKSNIYPIENWTNDLVKEWLAVVNLHRYAEVFAKYNINGSKLISLSSDQLYEYRIRDSFHHKAIIECCQELTFRSKQYSTYSQMLKEMNEFRNHLNLTPYKASRHYFLMHTLSIQTNCSVCYRPFLGIIHQCLLCQQCGIMVHRQCSSIGLPDCKSKNIQSKHYLFGVSLFDLCNTDLSSTNQDVPLLLIKAFKCIEERAQTTGEDLYDAYRLSADTTKIEPIKQQLNENGIELTRFERYDLNTIAALVKSFLRDLQNSVIPEEIYSKLIDNIQTISSNDLRELIKSALHPQHLACLKYIMAHLIRTWNYQFKTRGCHYLPDKIFHIFRSILMRPPWENIVKIVYNIDKQTLVIQRLMLECDWGEELPEYRIKPDKTLFEPNHASPSHSIVHSVNNLFLLANKILPGSNKPAKITQSPIDNQEWYWNNIVNRDNTALILKNCPDGSFIVRNSTDKNPTAPYTLCVMKGTFVKSIKIFHSDQLYDIEKPCRFESVQALIDYYSRISLKEYNHNLDLRLTYGVSKFKFGRTSEWTIDKLYASFREALDKYESLTKSFMSLESDISSIREDLTNKRLACEAFDKIIEMYENQKEQAISTLTSIQLKKSNAISATTMLVTQFMPSSRSNDNLQTEKIEKVMLDNKLRLEKKTLELRGKKEEVEKDIDYLNINLSELQERLDALRPEIIELRKKRENYHMWLLQRGENEDKILTVIEPVRASLIQSESKDTLLDNYDPISQKTSEARIKPSVSMGDLNNIGETNDQNCSQTKTHLSEGNNTFILDNKQILNEESFGYMDSSNWFRTDFDRDKAEEVLKDQANGTFLVRSSQFPGSKYVLSVVTDNKLIHILIDEFQNKYFLKSNKQSRRLKYTLSQPVIRTSSSNSSRSRSPSSSERTLVKSTTNSAVFVNDENKDITTKFDTLTHLITFYSKNELKIGNESWNTILSYPAFYNASN